MHDLGQRIEVVTVECTSVYVIIVIIRLVTVLHHN
jgi:hypothetical protein